jgi:hypothetical protein
MSKTYDKLKPETYNDPEFEKALERAKEKALEEKEEKEEKLDELTANYQSARRTGLYNYITEIDNQSMFFFCSVFLFIFSFINRFRFTTSSIIAIIVATLVVYFLNERRRTTQFTDMAELEIKLVRITPNPKYFHLDAGIVELIYSIREFRNYNNEAFEEMILMIDQFLAMVYDVENDVADCHHAVQLAQSFKKQALNHLMSIIHRTPMNDMAHKKLRAAVDSLHFILNHHISNMKKQCNKKIKKDGLNATNSLVITNHPNPFDTNYKNNFDIF